MPEKLLTTGQAARLCSVTPDTILKWIRAGKLNAIRTAGGHHRVEESEIRRLTGLVDESVIEISRSKSKKAFRYCWEYNSDGDLLEDCRECIVYKMRAHRCYEVMEYARDEGHKKIFCKGGCDTCEYFRLVHKQSSNILVVTNNDILAGYLRRNRNSPDFNLEITDCEYGVSTLVDLFRPDYAIIDCSLGKEKTGDIVKHLFEDPRIPHVRIILAANKEDSPASCEREVFARIEKPFSVSDIVQFLSQAQEEAG